MQVLHKSAIGYHRVHSGSLNYKFVHYVFTGIQVIERMLEFTPTATLNSSEPKHPSRFVFNGLAEPNFGCF